VTAPVLWQFRFSHYNEKARWALDWKGIGHERRSLVPGLHIPQILWLTGQKSLPVLVSDGKAIADSTRIIAALEALRPDPPLYPRDDATRRRALALEDFCDEELGAYVRRAVFHTILPDTDYCVALLTTGSGPAMRTAYRGLFPLVRRAMQLDMGIDALRAARARDRIAAGLDRVAAEVQPSGYLAGDAFTVADLTAAALLSPLLVPEEYPYPLPGPLPPAAAALCATFADHPAMHWAEEIYRRHRPTAAAIAA
jgi:glutathione S-transferase